ncbi:DUF2948 family protein [Boseongicola aestuarii]|jgi:hypothetical protein|uniref:DUF2948 domain-containing protein n=1 Tax=Boseongicola aestuarii TaxID=1470561 RepID=A0A238J4L6_9RHOB|nr:DUF2948 family protein [Boseongicola aestuarii]SMX25261.1 hypothetical protein BOA8489_03399 [Boseongicola aestuarii]
MVEDARFEDGGEKALRLKALEPDELPVIASLVQDAVFPGNEMKWDRRGRRFALLLNRFRWEDGRSPERVQSVLTIEDAVRVASQGVERGDADMVLSLLTLEWEPGEDGTGACVLTLAGDGAIRVEVEALEVTLTDVTRPYVAPSGKRPEHPGD